MARLGTPREPDGRRESILSLRSSSRRERDEMERRMSRFWERSREWREGRWEGQPGPAEVREFLPR